MAILLVERNLLVKTGQRREEPTGRE